MPVRSSRETRPRGWLLYLGRPQDPKGFGSYSTWGNPKTVLPHRSGSSALSTQHSALST
ncbi:hypothetical protein [Dendronalium phyllosphericum]|uniref:hypothetical protein n=1 Tax=Dendronalium phyllosphericum TaxID=2840445 RepID=UPI001BDD0659|nr:hypothetical protein [Dendronalium phyllosphericum]